LLEVSVLARVKSEAVRKAILSAAVTEFSEKGYLKTTVNSIASGAGTAPSNVYVYFASKLEIVLAIYEPWFRQQILSLEKAVAKKKTREQKIRCLVEGLLRDIADDEAGYTSTLIAALATTTPPDGYRPDLLLWAEDRIASMIGGGNCEGGTNEGQLGSLARMLMLVFDGVAVRSNLKQNIGATNAMLSALTEVIASGYGAK
jgi:AcrR family transcriptional regulator